MQCQIPVIPQAQRRISAVNIQFFVSSYIYTVYAGLWIFMVVELVFVVLLFKSDHFQMPRVSLS